MNEHLICCARKIGTASAVAVLFLIAASPLPSQTQRITGPAAEPIKVNSVAVNVYAIVTGNRGRLIPDLNKDDFQLLDDGVPQKIQYFSRETTATLSLGIAIDTSISQNNLLAVEQNAARQFVRSVLRTDDQAFVMSFDVDVKLLHDFTGAAPDLAQAIDSAQINQTGRSVLQKSSTNPTGGTHLYDAVYLASNELMKTRHGRKVLVLVTDGEDQGSRANLQNAIESAENANVIVYSIVASDPQFYALLDRTYHGDKSVRRLAQHTGGQTIQVSSVGQIGQAFQQIARQLRSQYLLSYSPSGLRHDGSFRRIQVKVRGHYAVRTRAGYYDRSVAEPR